MPADHLTKQFTLGEVVNSMKVAILVPVCSRNQTWSLLEDCFWIQHALPALTNTFSPDIEYSIYIGVDDDDAFFMEHRERLGGRVVILSGCQHAPAWAWNRLFDVAVADGHDYFFQLGDDVVLETPNWTTRFIEVLQRNNNRGVVGPCNTENYNGRIASGKPGVIENAFVHRTHHELFGTFYPPEIRNWYCDDWITEVYKPTSSHLMMDITVRNMSLRAQQQRYAVQSVDITDLIRRGRAQIQRGCFSFCLYGPYTDKYYRGLLENVALIREHYPAWTIAVYASPLAHEFVMRECPGVKVYPTGREDAVNTLYRFLPIADRYFDVVCVRDTDSRIHARDRWCIERFIESPYQAYTIRDHAWHRYRVMCGLWGCKRANITRAEIEKGIAEAIPNYRADADFVECAIYPKIVRDMVVYCYRTDGLFDDPIEKVELIQYPILDKAFCGNVMLYNPQPYYEFEPNCT